MGTSILWHHLNRRHVPTSPPLHSALIPSSCVPSTPLPVSPPLHFLCPLHSTSCELIPILPFPTCSLSPFLIPLEHAIPVCLICCLSPSRDRNPHLAFLIHVAGRYLPSCLFPLFHPPLSEGLCSSHLVSELPQPAVQISNLITCEENVSYSLNHC